MEERRRIVVGAHGGLGAAILAAGLFSGGVTRRADEEDMVAMDIRDPEPPRPRPTPKGPTAHDLGRIEAAERKRARKAARLRSSLHPSPDERREP